MTLLVLDLAYYWPYFDPTKGEPPKLTREIYSDPYGSAKASENPINVDASTKARLSGLTIWAGNWIDAIQQGFGGGELGSRKGNQKGGSQGSPKGWNGMITADNPVVEVIGHAGEVVGGIRLIFKDGTATNPCGGYSGSFYTSFLQGHVLLSLYVSGENRFYGVAETVICGFRLEDSY